MEEPQIWGWRAAAEWAAQPGPAPGRVEGPAGLRSSHPSRKTQRFREPQHDTILTLEV